MFVAIDLRVMFFYDFVFLFSCGWVSFLISDLCIFSLLLIGLIRFYFTDYVYLYYPLFHYLSTLQIPAFNFTNLQS